MANNCAICGASINVFQAQKLADGNYLCRKVCCKKALNYFDFVNATLPEYQAHVAQVERGTKIWEQLFVPRLKEKDKTKKLKTVFSPIYIAPDLGLMALVETRFKLFSFKNTKYACVYRIDELVGYEMETETKTVEGKTEKEYYVHYCFRCSDQLSDFRVKYSNAAECGAVAKYFNELFGIQKTLFNSINNMNRQVNAIKGVASAISAAASGADDAETKGGNAIDALDAAVYGDRSALKAKADAALAAFHD